MLRSICPWTLSKGLESNKTSPVANTHVGGLNPQYFGVTAWLVGENKCVVRVRVVHAG